MKRAAAEIEPDDESLVLAVRSGDERAFDALVGRYQDRVYRLGLRLTGDAGDAEEALQEAFLQVYRKLDTFRGEAKFSTWLYRVATNAALMQRRSRERQRTEPLGDELPAVGAGTSAPAEARLDQRRLAARALAAVSRLPDLYRSVFVLRDLEELSTAEVASALGVDAAVVRQRLHRARLMLRGLVARRAEAKP